MVVEIKEVIKEYIKGFVKNLYDPPRKSGFTTVVASYARIIFHLYSKNRSHGVQGGALKANAYYKEGLRGLKVFVFDHSKGTLDEIEGFSKFC